MSNTDRVSIDQEGKTVTVRVNGESVELMWHEASRLSGAIETASSEAKPDDIHERADDLKKRNVRGL